MTLNTQRSTVEGPGRGMLLIPWRPEHGYKAASKEDNAYGVTPSDLTLLTRPLPNKSVIFPQ